MAERVMDWKSIGRIAAGAMISFLVWKVMQYTVGHHIDRYATRRIAKKYGDNGNGETGAEGAAEGASEGGTPQANPRRTGPLLREVPMPEGPANGPHG